MASSSLICEYYCEVGVRTKLESKRSQASAPLEPALLDTVFEPTVLLRCPAEDRPRGMKFAPEVAMFVFPHGVRLATPEYAAENAIPKVTSFVLTAADKSRMYGACIVWYEALPTEVAAQFLDATLDSAVEEGACSDAAVEAARRAGVHAPEAICLLSRVAIFDTLMECCRQLFRMRISSPDGASLSEKALAPLLNTPLPALGGDDLLPLGNVSVPVSMPAANLLPHTMAGRDFLHLFQCLDVSSVMMIWALLLAEQKVVLQAKQPHILTMAAETLHALLFPFRRPPRPRLIISRPRHPPRHLASPLLLLLARSWQHVYIPILPARLLDILQARRHRHHLTTTTTAPPPRALPRPDLPRSALTALAPCRRRCPS